LLLSGPRLFIFINCSHEEGKTGNQSCWHEKCDKVLRMQKTAAKDTFSCCPC